MKVRVERFTESDVKAFLTYLGEIRTATLEDLRKKLMLFYNVTGGELDSNSILLFINDRGKCSDPAKYFNPAIRFLRWLQDVRGVDLSNLVNLLENAKATRKRKRTKKMYAEENSLFDVTLEDVHGHILDLYRSPLRPVVKLRAITASALAASTGLRPEELKRLEASDINIDDDYFILPAEKSKTWTERVIPLHPDVKKLMKLLLYNSPSKLFPDGSLRHVFSKAGKLQLRQFRKFFAVYSLKVGLSEPYRVAIMGHDTEELERLLNAIRTPITEEHYRKFTPEAIVEEYMKTWGRVRIVPERVKFS